MAVTGIVTIGIMPVMLVIKVAPLVGLWVLLPLVLGLTGVLGGTTNTLWPGDISSRSQGIRIQPGSQPVSVGRDSLVLQGCNSPSLVCLANSNQASSGHCMQGPWPVQTAPLPSLPKRCTAG